MDTHSSILDSLGIYIIFHNSHLKGWGGVIYEVSKDIFLLPCGLLFYHFLIWENFFFEHGISMSSHSKQILQKKHYGFIVQKLCQTMILTLQHNCSKDTFT